MRSMLIAFAGLPGTGKTTIARSLAHRLGAVYLRVDTIEQALRSCDLVKAEIGPAGYVVAYRIAEDNLRTGQVVVADSVNPLPASRDAWLSVARRASARVAEIEVVCSDKTEHRRRIETREPDIEGMALPTWQEVLHRKYERWNRQPIVIDTAAKQPDAIVTALLTQLGFDDVAKS